MIITGILYRDDEHRPIEEAVPFIAGLYRAKTGMGARQIAVSEKQYRGLAIADVIAGVPVVLDQYIQPWHYHARIETETYEEANHFAARI